MITEPTELTRRGSLFHQWHHITFLILFLSQSWPCLLSNSIILNDRALLILSIFLFLYHFFSWCPLCPYFSCPYLDTIHLQVPLSSTNIKYYSVPRTILGTRDVRWIQPDPSFRRVCSIMGKGLVWKMLQEHLSHFLGESKKALVRKWHWSVLGAKAITHSINL